jgi:hypothetical protein
MQISAKRKGIRACREESRHETHESGRHRKYLGLILLAGLGIGTARADLITNGGFESGFTGWTTVNETGSFPAGSWFVQSGTTSPINGFPVPAPPGGIDAAMTDQSGAGSHALLQSFTVDPASTVTLSFDLFVNNLASGFFTPASLDFNTIPNQQARVDILTAGAGAFDLGSSVVDNVLTPSANSTSYVHYSFDLTNAIGSGGTFQIRFAEVDNQLFFNLGVDNVSIQASPSAVPEPRSWGMLVVILLGLGGMRRLTIH